MKVSNRYFELLGTGNEVVKSILGKPFTSKTSYWVAKWFSRCESEAKLYMHEKQRVIEKYACRHENDGEEIKGGKIIRTWKKGDIVSSGGTVEIANARDYIRELEELQCIEIDLDGVQIVKFKPEEEPKLTPEEMLVLLPIIDFDIPE